MSESNKLIGNQYFENIFEEAVRKSKNGTGSIILLPGEAGFGKTYILNHYHQEHKKASKGVRAVYAEGQAPIGKFNVGNIQPLYPFTKSIEQLLEQGDITPEKRFAKNVGLTLLASIPLIDTVFYAVKEIGRDWRQFKNDKSSERAKKVSSATADYYDSIQSFADKMPILLLMDDMHWADSQSVELLGLLAENIESLSLIIVLSYRRSMLEAQNLPLHSFILNYQDFDNIMSVELDSFDKNQISELAAHYFPNYKPNTEFEEWIHEHSYGVPGVASEYLNYFKKYPPFLPDGSLATNFKGNEYLPSTVQSVFTQHLESLTEEERNILAVCSAEGREFTALVAAHLLNTDVLSAIRKLKSLQSKTGIIKSIGAEHRYGVKTTVFKFNQAFYHTYFENSLEYEEYTSLHGQIAAFLKMRFESADNDILRENIAPYLAAHSIESGDEETAKNMLLMSAKQAERYGSNEIMRQAYDSFSGMKQDEESDNLNKVEFYNMLSHFNSDKAGNASNEVKEDDNIFSDDEPEFKLFVKSITNDIIGQKYESAGEKAEIALQKTGGSLNQTESALLMTLLVKCYLSLHQTAKAEKILNNFQEIVKVSDDEQIECLLYNSSAQYHLYTGNMPKAYYFLDKSAALAPKLPQELKLLTLANIGQITKSSSPKKATEYMNAARRLSLNLGFSRLAEELN
ncbi:MAG: AAA family ATPase [Candidatus Kapaibacterium sp.]|jgi:hypothetical protein|nr:AAA family ATPase [Candidatus Kapabacteria bacterium]